MKKKVVSFLGSFFCCVLLPTLLFGVEPISPIKIGWIGPLTGNSAVLGIDSLNAIKIVLKKVNASGGINGRLIELVVEDDQYQAAKTVTAYQKLVSVDKIKFMYVITYSGLFSIADRALKDGVVLIDPLDCDHKIAALNQNVFCVAKETETLGTLAAELVVARHQGPTGILYFEKDLFPQETARYAKERLESFGAAPVVYEGYTEQTSDFNSMISKLQAKKVKSLLIYGYDEMATLLRQMHTRGFSPALYSYGTVTSPGFVSGVKGIANGMTVVVWQAEGGERYSNFIDLFAKEYGRKPYLDISTVPSYDIAELVVSFLSNLTKDSATYDSEKLRELLYGIKGYAGASGTITIDPDGITRSFTQSARVYQNGELIKQ